MDNVHLFSERTLSVCVLDLRPNCDVRDGDMHGDIFEVILMCHAEGYLGCV